jgi:CRISPR-associated protein Csb2
MAIAIAIAFPTGRMHSTPWGHHVNEGMVEWPPSPWRLLRALVAVWKRKFAAEPSANVDMPNALAKLTSPPFLSLPPASLGHTRHYMPWFKKGPQDKTLVFDTFVALDPGAEVVFLWPEATLNASEEETLHRILSQLNYFGRAESWCSARLCRGWELLENNRWVRSDKARGDIMIEINCMPLHNGNIPSRREPVRVLAPCPERWNHWDYRKARPPDPPWNLLAETADLHAERWSDPPGSRWVTYLRPSDAFAGGAAPHTSPRRRPKALVMARYTLDGTVLPLLQETLSLAELARRRLQGIYGKQYQGRSSATFSGKTPEGLPLQDHRHAFYLPTDEDGDGRLDHLTIYARGRVDADGHDVGFEEEELQALEAFRELRQVGGKPDLRLVLLGVGDRHNWQGSVLDPSRIWRSHTPFVPPRHEKTRGRRRETPLDQLLGELQRRGFPEPVTVTAVPRCELQGRSIRWIEFRRERLFGGGRRGQGLGYGFAIEFSEPVDGPLCLGYGCHFGLGLFLQA